MPAAAYLQSSFLGGHWSKYHQGRMDNPKYREALNVCRNGLPVEEGAWTRRPGTNYIAATRGGAPATLREFAFSENAPYNMEFTDGHLRFTSGNSLVLEPTTQNVVAISTANPAVVQTAAAHNWANGDEVQFNLPAGATDTGTHELFNRQFSLTVVDDTHFSIADSVSGAGLDGSLVTLGGEGTLVSRVLDFVTPYTGGIWSSVRAVQAQNKGVNQVALFQASTPPQVLQSVANPDSALAAYATFTLAPAVFKDGPYLDPVTDGGTVTPSALTGVVTLTVGYIGWSSTTTYGIGDTASLAGVGYISLVDNNLNHSPDVSTADWAVQSGGASVSPSGFVSTDVGRSIRLFSEPAEWAKGASYAAAAVVKFDGAYYSAIQASTGKQPGLDVVNWAVDSAAATWTWAKILTVVSATEVTAQLYGGALLYTNPIVTWQMGRYSDTTGYPTGGVYHEGRLWIFGKDGNHFDASVSNDIFNFAETGADGTVSDNNAISETLNDAEVNAIFWMMSDHSGVVCGTQGGEWLIQASSLSDPLTPTSIQAHKVTKYGCQNVEPRRTGIAFMVVQRYAKKMLEFLTDLYSGKYIATNIALTAADLTAPGIAEIAYQRERVPIIWARTADGKLIGTTYKRELAFGSSPPTFAGWHEHDLGSGRILEALQSGPSVGGDVDSVTIVTNDPATNVRWLEVLTDVFAEDQPITEAWFLDGAARPWGADRATVNTKDGIKLWGYHYLEGKTVTVWGGGLDLGDYTVSDGEVFVPFGADAGGLFTLAYLEALAAENSTFNNLAVFVNNGTFVPLAPQTGGLGEFTGGAFQNSSGGVASGTVDWANNLFYVPGSDVSSNAGFSQYSLPGMTVTGSVSQTALMGGTGTDDGIGAGVVGADGNYYWSSTSANSGAFSKMSKALVLVDKLGSFNSSFQSSQAHIVRPRSMCAISCNAQYVAQTSLVTGNALHGGSGAEVCLINGTTMKFIDSYGLDQPEAQICTGKQTNDGHGHFYGEAFATAFSLSSFVAAAHSIGTFNTPISLWRLSINSNPPAAATYGFTNVASITPEAVDANWHWWDSVGGIAFDPADGNVLQVVSTTATPATWAGTGADFLVGSVVLGSNSHAYACAVSSGSAAADPTTDAGAHWTDKGVVAFTNTCYLIKINAATGAVIWKLALASDPTDAANWNQSKIANSRLGMIVGADVLWINTSTGSIVTTTAVIGVSPQAQQMWGPGGLIVAVDYTSGGGAPTPVSPCVGSFSNHWGFFLPSPSTAPPALGPFVVGYTYTSQGQLLRPISPQETGTRAGPALGNTRRSADVAVLFHGAQGVSLGSDFTNMHVCNFMALGPLGTIPSTALQLYSDVYWDKLEDDYSFNSRPAWQITRPYPATVLAVEANPQGQDRA